MRCAGHRGRVAHRDDDAVGLHEGLKMAKILGQEDVHVSTRGAIDKIVYKPGRNQSYVRVTSVVPGREAITR